MARFHKIRTGAICIKKFADKRTFANTGRISFDNTDYMVNETRAYAAARSRIAGCRVGTCNVGERPIIDIKESGLGAFKKNLSSFVKKVS